MDIKKAPYEIVYEERMKQLGQSLKSEHQGAPPSQDPQMEIKPKPDSIQLGEGARK